MSDNQSQITSIKSYIPSNVISNEALETKFGIPRGAIEQKTGLKSRYYSDPDEHPTDMGMKCIQMILQETGLDPASIDMIISASATKDQPIPTDAMHYAHKLDLEEVQTCHMEVVCLSFVQALEIADLYIRSGKRKRILIVSAEKCSSHADPEDPHSSTVLGDGAAAALIEPSTGASRIEASRIITTARKKNLDVAVIKGGGTKYLPDNPKFTRECQYFYVDGPLQYRLSLKHFPGVVNYLLDKAGCTYDDIDYVIPHQVIPRLIESITKSLGFDLHKVYSNDEFGNQAAAAIPIGLARSVESGKIQRGNRILLMGGAAGFSVGGIVMTF